jgi:hypothetical protein
MDALTWTTPMIDALYSLRRAGHPLDECADKIGVCYYHAMLKARELNLAGRMNRGNIAGVIARQQDEDRVAA